MNTGSGDGKMNEQKEEKKPERQTLKLKKKLQHFLMRLWIPMLLLVIIVLTVLGWYAVQYNRLSHNVTTTSQFSLDFKKNLDLKMYYFSVGNRLQKELPLEDVDQALKLVESLEGTTSKKESRKALDNLRSYCENLRDKMFLLADTEDYDSRQLQLENNIKILTRLIQDEMHTYIHYETVYLAQMEEILLKSIWGAMAALIIFAVGMILILLREGMRFSKEISAPVSQICENIRAVGNGQFHIEPVQTYDYEMGVLDDGVQTMSRRIEEFIEKEKQEQEQNRLREFQLLQAQINPHFLYNTLDTVVWLIEAGEKKEAMELVEKLSVFFRTFLSRGNDIISLKEELLHISSYLDIQKVRYGDIMDYEITIPESMMEVQIPKMTLQPLVENALYHGIKKIRRKGLIQITGEASEDEVILNVSDNGIGMTRERLEEVRRSMAEGEKCGFGLSAVNERIKLYFGAQYGISIESEEGRGSRMIIRLGRQQKIG